MALRRILGQVVVKKRASANSSERQAWAAEDLLFVSNYGEGDTRQISFAHFATPNDGRDLPTLKVLGWDNRDTALHLDAVTRELTEHLAWPDDEDNADAWREQWRSAFTLRHREVITTSKQLSERLAELARAIRDRIRTALAIETEAGPLTKLMRAFQTALVHDLDEAGFADMYAQTIAYGLLSARITDPARRTAADFAAHMRTNPFLRELMEIFLRVGGRRSGAGGPGIDFDELGVSEVVELLDRATGTGTFLVEIIDLVHRAMVEKWKAQGYSEKKIQALWNDYVPKHLLPRLHGYELLMAPYAIAHLKIGLKLYETGYRFESDERARVYMTNALEPPGEGQLTLSFLPALAHEAEAVNEIKRKRRFTVMIGNPPYLGEAGRGGDWIAAIMRGREIQSDRSTLSYFEIDGESLKERNPKWLNDFYVRFTRLSHWLLEQAGRGFTGSSRITATSATQHSVACDGRC